MSTAIAITGATGCLCLAGSLCCTVCCASWCCKRICRHGSTDSAAWPAASEADIRYILHYSFVIQGAYTSSVERAIARVPILRRDGFLLFVNQNSGGLVPPHFIYVDHDRGDLVVCIRGLHMASLDNYKTLAYNAKGWQQFECGYVHHGLMQAARWLLDNEAHLLCEQLAEYPDYTVTIVGHSLGSGVAALYTILLASQLEVLGPGFERARLRCYAFAAARSMSLSLSLPNADIIKSVVLQDDFLPRTSTPIMKIVLSASIVFCLYVFGTRFLKDQCFQTEQRILQDHRRLYSPGQIFHLVYKEPCSCSESDPLVRTAEPILGRFERLILSASVGTDHEISEYFVRFGDALECLQGGYINPTVPPEQQFMQRSPSLRREQLDAWRTQARGYRLKGSQPVLAPPALPSPSGSIRVLALEDAPMGDDERWVECGQQERRVKGGQQQELHVAGSQPDEGLGAGGRDEEMRAGGEVRDEKTWPGCFGKGHTGGLGPEAAMIIENAARRATRKRREEKRKRRWSLWWILPHEDALEDEEEVDSAAAELTALPSL